MSKRRKNNDDMYYGDLPSNYLANLGKEIVAQRAKEGKTLLDIKDNQKSEYNKF